MCFRGGLYDSSLDCSSCIYHCWGTVWVPKADKIGYMQGTCAGNDIRHIVCPRGGRSADAGAVFIAAQVIALAPCKEIFSAHPALAEAQPPVVQAVLVIGDQRDE